MPIFDFICNDCKEDFESMVKQGESIMCPACDSTNLTKLLGAAMVMGHYKEKWNRQPPSPPTKVYMSQANKDNNNNDNVLGHADKANTRTKRARLPTKAKRPNTDI